MHLPSLFVLIVYVSGYLFLLFAAICLACGLYYLIEIVEEFTSLSKKLIRSSILVLLVLHFLLLVYERFPLLQCSLGFVAHLSYLNLLSNFPYIEPLSFQFILSCTLFVLDNVVWFLYFRSDVELFYQYRVAPYPAIAAFFLLIVWLVPCAFFCSLTINDAVLPASHPNFHAQSGVETHSGQRKSRRRNVVMMSLDRVAVAIRQLVQPSRRSDLFSTD